MEFGPIWRAAMRNKTGMVLVVLQVAFTMTLVVNAFAIAQDRARLMARPSGIDEANIFHLRSAGFDRDFDPRLTIEEDLRQIRGLPGVQAAVQMNSVPLSGGGWSMGLKTELGDEIEGVGTAVYMVDEHGLDALGVELVAGENFTEADVTWRDEENADWPGKVILTRALAEAMFPDDATYGVGRTVYIADTQPMTVVGIVARLQAPWVGWSELERSILVPQHLDNQSAAYLIRAEPGRRDALMPRIETILAERERGRIIQNMQTMDETRERIYEVNQALINILWFTVAVLVGITTLGVAGLTSFNVTRRYKQIGTRRALGATRGAIQRYFLAETFLFTGLGVVLGAALAVGVNMWLVTSFNAERFSWLSLPLAMVALVGIGQLAVLFPAHRAARVAPAVATRTI